MSSATSTEARLKPDATDKSQSLQPWQFFVLAALGCATAVTFLARGQGLTAVLLLVVLMGTAAVVGMAALRTVRPLVSPREENPAVVGERIRGALERDKLLTLRAIKDLEFDHAMGKVSDEDFGEITGRLRARATRIIRQLDAGAGYRQRIESDLAKRIGEKAAAPAGTIRECASCSTRNDTDAKFCKTCGARL